MTTHEKKLIAALTPTTGYIYYPPYLNVSRSGDYGTKVTIILRGTEKDGGGCGDEAVATFSREEFAFFLLEAQKHLSD